MKRKILIIGPGMEIGGVERSLIGLLNSIDYRKYNVDLMLLSHTGEFMSLINPQVSLLPEEKKYALISLPISTLLKHGHVQIAAIRLWAKAYGALRAKVKHTESMNITICKKIITKIVHNNPKHYDIAFGFFAPHFYLEDKVDADVKIGWVHTDYTNLIERPDVEYIVDMWEKLDAIACVSEQVKQSFDSLFPSVKNKTIVVENILSQEFVKQQANNRTVESEMPKGDYTRILSVGRFCNAKAFDLIPEVCSILIRQGYPIRWYLLGYGPDEHLIRRRIQEHQVEEYVIVLGKKENPYPYMKTCDLYVQPSRYEGKAVTVVEAQILNKPVMITRYATASSQVDEGIDGHICEQGVDGIVDGVKHMIDHPEYCQLLIANTMKRQYGNESEIEKLFSILRSKT